MEDLSQKSPEELVELTNSTEDKDTLRAVAELLGLTYSGNTGVEKLKEKIFEEIGHPISPPDADDPVLTALNQGPATTAPTTAATAKSVTEMSKSVQAQLDPRDPKYTEIEKRAIVRAKAMRLHRVRITNLDPQDSAVSGAIITVFNKYTGKVSKYIPFGDENEMGYHVPEILLNELKSRTYVMRKEEKSRGGSFGVKRYRTTQVRKFAIEELPPLTKEELVNLANDQKARGAIDQHA